MLEEFMGYVATFLVHRPMPHGPGLARLGRTFSRGLVHDHRSHPSATAGPAARRSFHNFFVTHLPSSSLHPDSAGPHHKLPRAASTPHTPGPKSSPAAIPPNIGAGRELTVVRIPIRSAKHHFGASNSRGQRPYNEDTDQAGTIDLPAFAKRAPISLVRSAIASSRSTGEGINADSAAGDPQVFYFGVFDGHGGNECADFLRDELHGYIEEAARDFKLGSSLRKKPRGKLGKAGGWPGNVDDQTKQQSKIAGGENGKATEEAVRAAPGKGAVLVPAEANVSQAVQLQRELLNEYKNTVGGYFRRFKPEYFDLSADNTSPVTIESVLTYAFLRADLDFVTAQARKPSASHDDLPLNHDEILGSPHLPPSGHGIGGPVRFQGGATCSVALISTPSPAPFWHPAASSTLLVCHAGDSAILLCETATGLARPLTVAHHPSTPSEARRLTRFADSVVTDSFGEERFMGLANSRAFGDMSAKSLGVSAEPQITRVEMGPAEYSFLVLMSDGVSGSLSSQEVVDIVKEARTPEEASRDVISFATEVSADGDNATCLCVRLGGWERRGEGGLGSLGTRELRQKRRAEADTRGGRRG